MRKNHVVYLASLGTAVLAGLVVGCSSGSAHSDSPPTPVNTSPKNGNTVVLRDGDYTHTEKWCDGPNLVYTYNYDRGGGISVIPNSGECK